jgi:hypothetical protein
VFFCNIFFNVVDEMMDELGLTGGTAFTGITAGGDGAGGPTGGGGGGTNSPGAIGKLKPLSGGADAPVLFSDTVKHEAPKFPTPQMVKQIYLFTCLLQNNLYFCCVCHFYFVLFYLIVPFFSSACFQIFFSHSSSPHLWLLCVGIALQLLSNQYLYLRWVWVQMPWLGLHTAPEVATTLKEQRQLEEAHRCVTFV